MLFMISPCNPLCGSTFIGTANILDTKATQGASGLESQASTDFLTSSASASTLGSTPSLRTCLLGSNRVIRYACAATGSGIHLTTIDKTASNRGSQRLITA
ncbi:unnamed protein product [Prunus brigantina]